MTTKRVGAKDGNGQGNGSPAAGAGAGAKAGGTAKPKAKGKAKAGLALPGKYRLAAEWEPREATWLAWPHREEDWPGKFEPIPWVFAEMARLLAPGETVRIIARSGKARDAALSMLERARAPLDRIEWRVLRTDRGWLRDTGPMVAFDREGRRVVLDWKFNAWAKYEDYGRDDRIPKRAAEWLGLPRIAPRAEVAEGEDKDKEKGKGRRIVLEGGAIDVNGRGTLLTTEECLLSDVQERNPGFDREAYERTFAEWLGIAKVIWLGNGVAGDDTHGHVDDLARFVNADTVVCAVEEDPNDANHAATTENLRRLRAARDAEDKPLNVVALPMPRALVFEDLRLPASYANFYIGAERVLVPTFNDPADRRALAILAELFPDREVVGIHAVDLVWGLGTLHCLTRDEPRGLAGKESGEGESEREPEGTSESG